MSENRTIAKNSIILYIRLLVTTAIGLYASRVILLELGAENFGLIAVVGGIVALVNLMGSGIGSTSNRFIAVEIGKKNAGDPNKVFNSLLVVHVLLGLVLVLLVTTVGGWWVNNHLNIDPDKVPDAFFVLYFSGLTAVIGTSIMPFQSLVTIQEKFLVRSMVEVGQSLLHLGAVLLLVFIEDHKLRVYAFSLFLIQLTAATTYLVYCKMKFREIVKWRFNLNLAEYKEISRFFGWQILYLFGSVGYRQGGNIIINMFFGTVANAAFGIAARVNEFVFSFVKNLNQAAVPQIMKNIAGKNQSRSLTLVYSLSKITFFIMLIPATPLLLSIDQVLVLWLKEVPPNTSWFVALMIIAALISCLQSGFDSTVDATGKIRKSKFVFSALFLSTLPLAYLLLKNGYPPYTIIVLGIGAEIIYLLVQTQILAKLVQFQVSKYFKETIVPSIGVTILLLPQYFLRDLISDTFAGLIFISAISLVLTTTVIYFIGLNKQERSIITTQIGLQLVRLKKPS